MYELEKSDLGIVAKKPTNKAGQPVAESVERRPGTEGNANQQSTLRTQSRDRVTQALGRVWQTTNWWTAVIPKVGAGCLNWARPDLCGGMGVIPFPTATARLVTSVASLMKVRSPPFADLQGRLSWAIAGITTTSSGGRDQLL
jgi:hypothetical protein